MRGRRSFYREYEFIIHIVFPSVIDNYCSGPVEVPENRSAIIARVSVTYLHLFELTHAASFGRLVVLNG